MLGGNSYVFFAWKGKNDISQTEQTTLSLAMASITFIGGLLVFLIRQLEKEENQQQEWIIIELKGIALIEAQEALHLRSDPSRLYKFYS